MMQGEFAVCGSEKVTLGHEFAGTVVTMGPGAGNKFSVGDNVGVDPNLPCHRCQFCVRGERLPIRAQNVRITFYLTNHRAGSLLSGRRSEGCEWSVQRWRSSSVLQSQS